MIPKQQLLQIASNHADAEADDYANNVTLTLDQHVILKAKIEAAMLCGMELAAEFIKAGYLLNTTDLKPTLFRNANGDKTYTMKIIETDGGGLRSVHETELPDCPKDGK